MSSDTQAAATSCCRTQSLTSVVLPKPGGAVTTVCPPYGVTDARVEEVCVLAGYRQLFTIEEGVSPVSGTRLALPRHHVLGGEDIHAFAEKLGLADDEPPEPADDPATWKAAGVG